MTGATTPTIKSKAAVLVNIFLRLDKKGECDSGCAEVLTGWFTVLDEWILPPSWSAAVVCWMCRKLFFYYHPLFIILFFDFFIID